MRFSRYRTLFHPPARPEFDMRPKSRKKLHARRLILTGILTAVSGVRQSVTNRRTAESADVSVRSALSSLLNARV